MKTIISITFGILLSLGTVSVASAQVYYSYNGNYQNTYQYQYTNQYTNTSSYYYTSGCTVYYHDGYTNTERYVRSTCQNQNQNTYTYTQPVTYTYYTQPTTYTSYTNTSYNNTSYNNSPYYTYGYNRSTGTWYPGYSNQNGIISSLFNTNNTYYDTNTYSGGTGYTSPTNCYYVNGYYACP
jgi:hypothetical protein